MGATDHDLAAAVTLTIEAKGPPPRLSLWRAAKLAGVHESVLKRRLPHLAPLVPEEFRPAVLSWPRGVRGHHCPDARLLAALTMLVSECGRFSLNRAALLAGSTPAWLRARLPDLLPQLPEQTRRVVEAARAWNRTDVRVSDADLAAAVELVTAAAGWCCAEKVGELVGLKMGNVRARLPGVLHLLGEDDRRAVLLRLAEDDEDELRGPDYEAPQPDTPTQAEAGSAEKVRIMAERAAAGLALFHPEDNKRLLQAADSGTGDEEARPRAGGARPGQRPADSHPWRGRGSQFGRAAARR